ncbi:SseB family protein [Microbacterium album]|uniref:SseB protein N-terminal domain-containing protein n=1 Tax=Microbacterium album TaxID=2053191 RepID=A0A917MM98_9MICO|nr:SseB family protein [Microbacterium album]GGH47480.1 hypothetical protein GCM10010921_24240 [Microbacterium album]
MAEERGRDGRPATVLERAISRAQQATLDTGTVLWVLAASDVVIINEGPPEGDQFPDRPLVVARAGATFLAVYTHRDLAAEATGGERVVVHVPALEVLRRVPASAGLVINPGRALGLEIPPTGLRAFTLDVLETSVSW